MERHTTEPRPSRQYPWQYPWQHPREHQHQLQHDHQHLAMSRGRWCAPQPGRRTSAAVRMAAAIVLAFGPGWARSTPQQFPGQEIKVLGTGGGQGIHIVTANLERSLDGCGGEFLLPATHPLLNQALAIALAAMYAKSRVQIEVDGCLGSGAMKVTGIQVMR